MAAFEVITYGRFWVIAEEPVFLLQMSDAWFDRGATFHPSP